MDETTSKKLYKQYLLPNVPLSHAAQAHGQFIFEANNTYGDSIRNRSSIEKRASKADWLSRNISLVLNRLLMRYENSYLPTHGQGILTVLLVCKLFESNLKF